jgi:hypothetical protein
MEEHRPVIQASTPTYSSFVCSIIAHIGTSSQEVLLESGSNISSISLDLVEKLKLRV